MGLPKDSQYIPLTEDSGSILATQEKHFNGTLYVGTYFGSFERNCQLADRCFARETAKNEV